MARSVLKAFSLVAVASLFVPGCSPTEPAAPPASGQMGGAMEKDKMSGGSMEKGEMGGAMEKDKMAGGAMEKGKMEGGAMEKDKMEGGAMEKGKMEPAPK